MKKRFFFKFILSLALFICSYKGNAQGMINQLDIPQPNEDMPSWAKLLYVTPLNVLHVKKAFDSYYETHTMPVEGRKNTGEEENEGEEQYVVYFHRLLMVTRNSLNKDGTINERREEENDQDSLADLETGRADIWTALNAEIYTSVKDNNKENVMFDQQVNIYCFDVFYKNTDIAYAGAETGGLFKTTNKGKLWKEISKKKNFELPTAIAIDPTDANVVLVGNNNFIYKTIDGGLKWTTILDVSELGVTAIEISPLDPTVAFAATRKGVYKISEDNSALKIREEESTDIAINPENPNSVFTVLKNKQTKFYECWKSVDQGEEFFKNDEGWPKEYTEGEALIGLTAADTSVIYIAMLAKPKEPKNSAIIPILEKSMNGGETWEKVYVGGADDRIDSVWHRGQGFYDFILLVSPTDAEDLIVGTYAGFKSTDGGHSFNCLSGNCGTDFKPEPLRIHCDFQAAKAIRNESWISSDGGITYSRDFYDKESISRVKGLNGTDWWGMGTGWNTDIIVGGTYHNGDHAYSEMYDKKTLSIGGVEESTGYLNPLADRNAYFSYSGGWKLPSSLQDELVSIPELSKYPNESYYPMQSSEIEWDPRCASIFYLGKDNKFYKTTDNGVSFKALFTAVESAKITQIEVSRKNPDVIYVVQRQEGESGKIWKTLNGGIDWEEILTIPNTTEDEREDMAITMSATDTAELWVGLHMGDNENKVFKTIDGGKTWLNLTTAKIGKLKVTSIMHQLGTEGGVYVGGSNGKIYYRNDKLEDWELYFSGLPVHYGVSFLKPFYRDNKIRTGGHGGLWEAKLYEPSTPLAQPMVDKLSGNSCPADTFSFDSYSVLSLTDAVFAWSFPGASYVSSTSDRNPKVVYSPGKHSVTLTVSNSMGTNTKTLVDLINVTAGTNTPTAPKITRSGSVLKSSLQNGNQWCLNGNPISGANGRTYTAKEMGLYTAIAIKNGCTSRISNSISIGAETVGIDEEVNQNQLGVYPNPNEGNFTIAFNSSERSSYILEIANILGQVIYKEEIKDFEGAYAKQLNVGEGEPGIYILSLSNHHNKTIEKIIVY